MEECLAIKPDLIFLWDEAWFGFARWSPFYRRRTAMGAAAILERKFKDPAYLEAYKEQCKKLGWSEYWRQTCLQLVCSQIRTKCAFVSTKHTQRTSQCPA